MAGFFDTLSRQLNYLASLPERTIRSLAAVAGGTTSLLTETLFPEVLRGTTMYRVFIGDIQQFVIRKVAQVQQEGTAEGEGETDPAYVQKKMVGGALETAGLFAMHMSPLWVFAIAGDAAAGSSVFLNRLVEQLKRNGVLPIDARVTGLEDLLAAMQDATRRSASAIDTPPLSREDLSKLAGDMTTSYSQMFARATDLLPRFETIWQRMEELARRENVSLDRLAGVLTVDVASWGRKGIAAAWAVGQTGTGLFGEKILDSYSKTLNAVAADGVPAYLSRHMTPFLQAATAHFDPSRKTWTESMMDRLLSRVRPAEPAPSEAAPTEVTATPIIIQGPDESAPSPPPTEPAQSLPPTDST